MTVITHPFVTNDQDEWSTCSIRVPCVPFVTNSFTYYDTTLIYILRQSRVTTHPFVKDTNVMSRTYTHTHLFSHTHTHTHTNTHKHTHKHTHTHTQTSCDAHTHTRTFSLSLSLTHTHTQNRYPLAHMKFVPSNYRSLLQNIVSFIGLLCNHSFVTHKR